MKTLLIVACLLALVGCAARPPTDSGRGAPFPRIANCYSTWLGPNDAHVCGVPHTIEEISRMDLLIGCGWPWQDTDASPTFKERLAEMKEHNPHQIVLNFSCSAPYSHIGPPEGWLAERRDGVFSPWLLTAEGKPIVGWPGTHMVNLALPSVVEFMAAQNVAPITVKGYDGTFIDCMAPVFDAWACEIESGAAYTVDINEDGEPETREQLDPIWRQAKATMSHRVRELIGDGPVFMTNQAGDDCYEDINGIYLEDYVDGVLDGYRSFESVLEEYVHWTRTPRRPNVTTLGLSSGIMTPYNMWELPKEEQRGWMEKGRAELQRMRFGLTMTLMGDGYYSYDMNTRWRGQHWWYPEYDAPLGYPTGDGRRHPDGTWRRSYDGGLVICNPGPWDVRVELDGRHRDVTTDQVGTSFLVPGEDGRILLPTDEPERVSSETDSAPALTREGPPGVVERDGTVVMRLGGGVAALFEPNGRMKGLWQGDTELVMLAKTVVVSDDRWRDFEFEDVAHSVQADGSPVFTGRRTDGEQALAYTQTVAVKDGALVLDFAWRAATDVDLHAFRQSIYLPVDTFGGGSADGIGVDVALPIATADPPDMAGDVSELAFTGRRGARIRISLSGDAGLIDDRHWSGPGYLYSYHPVRGKMAEGTEWAYRVVLAPL